MEVIDTDGDAPNNKDGPRRDMEISLHVLLGSSNPGTIQLTRAIHD